MTYVVFDDGKPHGDTYAKDLAEAARVLDPGHRLTFTLLHVPMRRGRDFEALAQRCDELDSQGDRLELLSEALVSGRALYEFPDTPRRTTIAERVAS